MGQLFHLIDLLPQSVLPVLHFLEGLLVVFPDLFQCRSLPEAGCADVDALQRHCLPILVPPAGREDGQLLDQVQGLAQVPVHFITGQAVGALDSLLHVQREVAEVAQQVMHGLEFGGLPHHVFDPLHNVGDSERVLGRVVLGLEVVLELVQLPFHRILRLMPERAVHNDAGRDLHQVLLHGRQLLPRLRNLLALRLAKQVHQLRVLHRLVEQGLLLLLHGSGLAPQLVHLLLQERPFCPLLREGALRRSPRRGLLLQALLELKTLLIPRLQERVGALDLLLQPLQLPCLLPELHLTLGGGVELGTAVEQRIAEGLLQGLLNAGLDVHARCRRPRGRGNDGLASAQRALGGGFQRRGL
mmetsp:Transcript_18780/g.33218  ORF Transcript_18780/g.33218 Transcript_18780/m.33218 type:complete len:357 (+) Transcript_18780:1014-2084(+)